MEPRVALCNVPPLRYAKIAWRIAVLPYACKRVPYSAGIRPAVAVKQISYQQRRNARHQHKQNYFAPRVPSAAPQAPCPKQFIRA